MILQRPWTIYVIALLLVQPYVVVAARGDFTRPFVYAFVVVCVLFALLWRRSRVAWLALVAIAAAVMVTVFTDQHLRPWWNIGLNLASLVILVLPPTLRHVWRRTPLVG